MIDLRDISYRVVCITPDGTQLDITSITTGLGWEEGEKELAARISLKVYNVLYGGKRMSQLVQPETPIFVYAMIGGAQKEMIRGTVKKWEPTYTNGTSSLSIEAYDEMQPLRRNQDFAYFADGTKTKAMITSILDKWSVPYTYNGPDITHNKMVFKKSYVSDMLTKILDDVKKKDGGVYFIRAKEGKVEIIPRGSNEDVYHFDEQDNTVSAKDSFDSGSLITRVIIVGKTDKEGHQKIEATENGKTEFGIHQAIIEHQNSKTLAQAQEAAKQMLKEKGALKRKTTIQAPDIPFVRKGDRVRISAGTVTGYFFIKSIRHNAEDQKMTFEVDEDKEKNKETQTDNGMNGTETSSSDEQPGGGSTTPDSDETSGGTQDEVD